MNQVDSAIAEGRASLRLELTSRSRVLVLGGYGVQNLGDEAILAGLLRQIAEVRNVTVVSRAPEETRALHGVQAVGPAAALLALFRSDALIVGGGGMFSSDTGPLGKYIPLFCRLALLRDIPVSFHGVGVYPSTAPGLLRSIRSLAPQFCSFTVRDAVSAELMQSLGFPVRQIGDLAESMPVADPSVGRDLLSSAGIELGRPAVGLCLTSIRERIADQLVSAVPELIESMPDVEFCFIPISQHSSNDLHNDALFGERLRQNAPRLRILRGVHHPAKVLAAFGQLDAAVCVRFHSHVLAHRAGVPIISIPYAEKCLSWLNEHGLAGLNLDAESLTLAVTQTLAKSTRQSVAA